MLTYRVNFSLGQISGKPIFNHLGAAWRWAQKTGLDVAQSAGVAAAGAGILNAAGHDGYGAGAAARAGAIGATVVFSLANGLHAVGPRCVRHALQTMHDSYGMAATLKDAMWTVPAALLGLAIGQGFGLVDMSPGAVAAATALGTAVCVGGGYAASGALKELGIATSEEAAAKQQTLRNLEAQVHPNRQRLCKLWIMNFFTLRSGYSRDTVLVATATDVSRLQEALASDQAARLPATAAMA